VVLVQHLRRGKERGEAYTGRVGSTEGSQCSSRNANDAIA
jgi:hypothetical protein